MPSRFQEMLKVQRQNIETSRAGLTWDREEESNLLDMVSKKIGFPEIALKFQRTEGSIKSRLFMIVCNIIDSGTDTEENVLSKYFITKEELDEFRLKKQKRDENVNQRQQNKNSKKTAPSKNHPYSIDDVMQLLFEIKNDLALLKSNS